MKRRTFIKSTASLAAGLGLASGSSSVSLAATGGRGMRIENDLLEGRNRNRSTVACRNGVVCTSQPLASQVGVDILKAGGNAVDAAVAANAMLSLVEPMSCGPGGDLFAILWVERDRKLYGLNASGRSPYEWNLEKAQSLGLKSLPEYSPLAWSVPGCVSGWGELLGRFGSKRMSEILAPTIEYAREGFPVSPLIARGWKIDAARFPTLARTFNPEGVPVRFGDIFRNPDLASFLETISAGGADAFYKGDIAERIVRSAENEGHFSLRDFHDHKAEWVDPVSTNYRGYDVWEIPPNGQGIAVLQILNMLETFDIGSLEPNSAEHLHLFIEAKKLAFEDRAVYYADMDFADVPLERLISKEYGKERAKPIDPRRALTEVRAGDPENRSETIYLTAADEDGNMVSLIQSTYYAWGAHIVPARLGFAVQNRGMSFNLDPNHRNRLEPHKRPFHTIIPAFVTKEGRPVLSFGVMGGDFQPQGHSQVLMNLLDFGMSSQQAGDQPRVRHNGSSEPDGTPAEGSGTVLLEQGIPDEVRAALADMGHRIGAGRGAHGGYQAIWREEDPRRYFAGSDPRTDGCAIGY